MRRCGRRDGVSETPDHHAGRERSGRLRLPPRPRQAAAAAPLAAGRRGAAGPSGAAREPPERLRAGLRDPAAAGPPGEPPVPAALPQRRRRRRLLPPGAAQPGRPGRRRPLAVGLPRPGQRGPAGRRRLAEPSGAARLAEPLPLPQPALQHRLRLLLPHLPPGPRGARRDALVAAGAARLLLLGGLGGAAVAAARTGTRRGAPRPRRAAAGGGQAAGRAGLGGGAHPAAELRGAPPQPARPALLRHGVAGVADRTPAAAPGPPAAAGGLGGGGGLPAGSLRRRARHLPGAGPGGAPAAPPAAPAARRGRQSACRQTPAEVELRVPGGSFGQLLRQQQDVQETLVALHLQRADDSLGLGFEAMVQALLPECWQWNWS